MDNIIEAVVSPYSKIRISLLVSSKNYDCFLKLYSNLTRSSFDIKGDVEILVKIDEMNIDYFSLLEKSVFKFKILMYPPYFRRYSNHIFFNDLGNISSGSLIWPLYEDCEIIKGDWYKTLCCYLLYNKYKDNIFNIAVPMDNGRGCKQICGANIITREWFDFFGNISPFPNVDRWLSELSRKIGRYETISEEKLLSHFPQGDRTLSKKQRKELFYPMMEESMRSFNRIKRDYE